MIIKGFYLHLAVFENKQVVLTSFLELLRAEIVCDVKQVVDNCPQKCMGDKRFPYHSRTSMAQTGLGP